MKTMRMMALMLTFLAASCVSTQGGDTPWEVDEQTPTESEAPEEVDEPEEKETPEEPEEPDEPEEPIDVTACVPSGDAVWDTLPEEEDAWLEPQYVPAPIEFSRDDGLVLQAAGWQYGWLQGQSRAYRANDGAMFPLTRGHGYAMDKSWSLTITADGDGKTQVVDRQTGEAIMQLEPGGSESMFMSAQLAASGTRAVGVACVDDTVQLIDWSLVSKERSASFPLGVDCDSSRAGYGQSAPRIHFAPDERTAVAVLRTRGFVASVGLQGGEVTSKDISVDSDEETETRGMLAPSIVDSALAPDGRSLLLSRGDGRVEIRSVPSLEETGLEIPATVETLNRNTYAPPAWASPVAWAPSGDLFVMLGESGDVEFRALDGELVHTVSSVMADDSGKWGMEDTAVALAYSHDGKKIAIGHYYGVSLWTCDGAEFPRANSSDDDAVELSVPSQIPSDESVEMHVSVEGYPGAVTRILIDGRPFQRAPTSPGTFDWHAYTREPGTHTVRAEFDDGFIGGATETTVEVMEAVE